MKTTQDRFVTYSQAAHVLGYKTYRSILALIDEGYLQAHSVSRKSRKYLKLSEVMKVAVAQSRTSRPPK
jgi:hypothetical protein